MSEKTDVIEFQEYLQKANINEIVAAAVNEVKARLSVELVKERLKTERLKHEFSTYKAAFGFIGSSANKDVWSCVDPASVDLHNRVSKRAAEFNIPYTQAYKEVSYEDRRKQSGPPANTTSFIEVDPRSVEFHEAVSNHSRKTGITYVEAYRQLRTNFVAASAGTIAEQPSFPADQMTRQNPLSAPASSTLGDWIDLLKASEGGRDGYSRDDLDRIISDFKDAHEGDVPLGLGRPSEHPEIYGILSDLRREDDILQGMFAGVDPNIVFLFQFGVLSRVIVSVKRIPGRISLERVGLASSDYYSGKTPSLNDLMKRETALRNESMNVGLT